MEKGDKIIKSRLNTFPVSGEPLVICRSGSKPFDNLQIIKIVFLKESFEKVNLENAADDNESIKKYPVCKDLKYLLRNESKTRRYVGYLQHLVYTL